MHGLRGRRTRTKMEQASWDGRALPSKGSQSAAGPPKCGFSAILRCDETLGQQNAVVAGATGA